MSTKHKFGIHTQILHRQCTPSSESGISISVLTRVTWKILDDWIIKCFIWKPEISGLSPTGDIVSEWNFMRSFYSTNLKVWTQIFVVTCSPLNNITSGEIRYSTPATSGRHPVKTVASFLCEHGYSRNGPISSLCQMSGNWSQESPTCDQSNSNSSIIFYIIKLQNYF